MLIVDEKKNSLTKKMIQQILDSIWLWKDRTILIFLFLKIGKLFGQKRIEGDSGILRKFVKQQQIEVA